eukprot:6192453-Pleurochrysis_carterae.AAC.2
MAVLLAAAATAAAAAFAGAGAGVGNGYAAGVVQQRTRFTHAPRMATEVTFGDESRQALLAGIDAVANAVKVRSTTHVNDSEPRV